MLMPEYKHKSFKHTWMCYLPAIMIMFLANFYFLPIRWNRNIYYVFIFAPFLFFSGKDLYRNLAKSRILTITFIYCFYMLISQVWSVNRDAGESFDSMRMALLVVVFLGATAIAFTNTRNGFNSLFKILNWTAGLSAIASIAWFGYIRPLERIVGVGALNSPIIAGSSYAAAGLMGLAPFFSKGSSVRDKLISLLPFLAIFTFIILTGSRGPLLAFTVVMILSSMLVRPRYLLLVLIFFGLPFAINLIFHLFSFSDLLKRGDSFRLTIWQQSIDIIRQHPWFGYGIGGDRPPIVFDSGRIAAHSHNLFLSNIVDGGMFALLLLISLLVMASYWAIRFFREEGNVTLLSLVFFAVAANLTDGKTLIVSPNYQWLYFWLPVALVAAYELRCKSADDTDLLAENNSSVGTQERVDIC